MKYKGPGVQTQILQVTAPDFLAPIIKSFKICNPIHLWNVCLQHINWAGPIQVRCGIFLSIFVGAGYMYRYVDGNFISATDNVMTHFLNKITVIISNLLYVCKYCTVLDFMIQVALSYYHVKYCAKFKNLTRLCHPN